jgi:hypothetical protein
MNGVRHSVWEVSNRLMVRIGPDAPVARALADFEPQVGELIVYVRNELEEPGDGLSGWDEAWAAVQVAERAFYAAAAASLDRGAATRDDTASIR